MNNKTRINTNYRRSNFIVVDYILIKIICDNPR